MNSTELRVALLQLVHRHGIEPQAVLETVRLYEEYAVGRETSPPVKPKTLSLKPKKFE